MGTDVVPDDHDPDERNIDGDASQPRHRLAMDLPLTRIVHRADARGQTAGDRHQDGREQGRRHENGDDEKREMRHAVPVAVKSCR